MLKYGFHTMDKCRPCLNLNQAPSDQVDFIIFIKIQTKKLFLSLTNAAIPLYNPSFSVQNGEGQAYEAHIGGANSRAIVRGGSGGAGS